jgi:hypothetical protein
MHVSVIVTQCCNFCVVVLPDVFADNLSLSSFKDLVFRAICSAVFVVNLISIIDSLKDYVLDTCNFFILLLAA